MPRAVKIGEAARDRADFRRCFKTGAAVFLHDDGIVAHSTYRNTPRAASPPPLSSPETGVTEPSQDHRSQPDAERGLEGCTIYCLAAPLRLQAELQPKDRR